ncbi:GNAT family N-acetyltransferase [uncultured Parvimonas sp.]|uniref:GNAT family N-acetyltransferase n=1 Tax=uncultured Parvimonas sp. TaxID=747372 RepID=UPI0028D5F0EE|nr:GNAT family N-acetyltransferase [uncultured Parvimonas sp.]
MDNFLIEDDDIKIKKFEKNDLKNFKNFSAYDDILLTDYNLCFLKESEIKKWEKKIKSKKNHYFAVFLNEIMIGYIGISRISFLNSNYELSLSLDEKYCSKGYGFKSLRLFLEYYFKNFDKYSIWLNVNAFNQRAIKLYEKIGFEKISEFLGDFEVQRMQKLKRYKETKEYFEEKNNIIYSKIFTMKLDRLRFLERWDRSGNKF